MDRLYAVISVLVLLVIAAVAIVWSLGWPRGTPSVLPPSSVLAPAVTPQTETPAIRHPIESPRGAASIELPGLDQAETLIESELRKLLESKEALAFLHIDAFVRRVVATVDNLPRRQAAARLWPVKTTPGRFRTRARGTDAIVSEDNSRRYESFVVFVESVNAARAVEVYRRLYPLFQQAYVELGFPHGYFNDRLLEVIDHLLQAPEPVGPIQLESTQVKSPEKPASPWLYFRFSDPALEALSSGQKMLVRTGTRNMHRLKAKLQAFKRELLATETRR